MDDIRFSDVLKKVNQGPGRGSSKAKAAKADTSDQRGDYDVRLSSVLNQRAIPVTRIDCKELQALYDGVLLCVTSLYQPGQESTHHSAVEIAQAVEKVADYFAQGHKKLHDLCSLDYPADESFLFRHAANVSIFCVSLGFALGLDRVCLIELGSAAAVHDIGMMQFRDMFTQTRTLTKEEYAKIKQHPDKGFETLARIAKGFSPIVCDAMRQEHERMDASGYPKGLKGEQIHAYGRIMGLVDVYEALLHRRPWRKRHTPMEAIKLLLEHKGAFAPHVLKALIEHIGIFPVGMPVRLSTKEIGVIVRGNPKFPLGPVVDIIVDAYGSELASPRPIDLAANSMVYIEECLERGDS